MAASQGYACKICRKVSFRYVGFRQKDKDTTRLSGDSLLYHVIAYINEEVFEQNSYILVGSLLVIIVIN